MAATYTFSMSVPDEKFASLELGSVPNNTNKMHNLPFKGIGQCARIFASLQFSF